MTFAESAREVRLNEQGGHILLAQLMDVAGEWRDAEIDLDYFIGNADGMLSKLEKSCF
jgi:hypothetical protein